MSDERTDDLLPEFEDSDEDVLLQAQMWVYNFVMQHWKKMLYGFGAILLVVLVQGLYTDNVVQGQRAVHAEMAMVKYELPEPNPMAQYGLAPKDNPNDEKKMTSLRASAKELERIASEGTGSASWFAWVDAAAVWERATETDAQIVALTKASELSVDEILIAVSKMQLANVYMQTDKTDDAIALLEGMTGIWSPDMKAQICLNLARIYLSQGNAEKAKTTLGQVDQAPVALQADIQLLQNQLDG
jgi:predicted negative regulator of RcsB-dependent stress response